MRIYDLAVLNQSATVCVTGILTAAVKQRVCFVKGYPIKIVCIQQKSVQEKKAGEVF